MVRLKQRYILFDILYPPKSEAGGSKENLEDYINFNKSRQNALLTLHRTSPSNINQKSLTQAIRSVIQDHFGDLGAGTAGMQFAIKYFSNKTSTGIIRCGRLSFQMVIAALALMNKIGDEDVIVRCIHVSGTIKKCEEYSIKRNRELMSVLKSGPNKTDLNSIISNFENEEEIIGVTDDESNIN